MSIYNLSFITDQAIKNHVAETVNKYRFTINLAKFNKNLVDPIKLTFDAQIYGKSIADVIQDECMRQIDKSNANHIGYFHQNLFGYISEHWQIPKQGFDLINHTKKIFVEIKNKHNTMNSSSSQKTYLRMQSQILKNPASTCFLVEVIAKKSQNIPWVISLDGEQTSHPQIRRISIDQFYALVTGDRLAYRDLCLALPQIIRDVVQESDLDDIIHNTVLTELTEISDDFLTSLYLMAFSQYQGFDNFQINL